MASWGGGALVCDDFSHPGREKGGQEPTDAASEGEKPRGGSPKFVFALPLLLHLGRSLLGGCVCVRLVMFVSEQHQASCTAAQKTGGRTRGLTFVGAMARERRLSFRKQPWPWKHMYEQVLFRGRASYARRPNGTHMSQASMNRKHEIMGEKRGQ